MLAKVKNADRQDWYIFGMGLVWVVWNNFFLPKSGNNFHCTRHEGKAEKHEAKARRQAEAKARLFKVMKSKPVSWIHL